MDYSPLGRVRGGVPFRFHEDKGREISVHPVRKFGRGFRNPPTLYFLKLRPFGRRLISNGVNISRITDLPTPEIPSQGASNKR